MKQTIRIIEEMGIDFNKLLDLYVDNKTRVEMAKELKTTVPYVRKACTLLNLRMKHKHRNHDYKVLQARMNEPQHDIEELEYCLRENDVLVEKIGTLQKSLQHARDELLVLRKTSRENARTDKYFNEIKENLESIISDIQINVDYEVSENNDYEDDYGLIAVIGDIHFGEIVTEDTVPSNEYNYHIAEQRLMTFANEVIMYQRQSKHLTVIDLKDTIRGIIHNGIVESEGSFIQSIQKAIEIEVKFFSKLAKYYETVTVYTTGDNHSRLYEKPATRDKAADYGMLIDFMVSTIMSKVSDNVEVVTTTHGYQMLNINSANILAFHGDTLRSFNVYSDTARSHLQDICIQVFNKPYRHSINGHKHTAIACANQYGGMSIQNGTLVGSNEYGINTGFRGIDAIQTILYVEKSGVIEDIKFVNLSDVEWC